MSAPSYPDKGLGPQRRPLEESFSGFDMLRDHFTTTNQPTEPLTIEKLATMIDDFAAKDLEYKVKLLDAIAASGVTIVVNHFVSPQHAFLTVGKGYAKALDIVREKRRAPLPTGSIGKGWGIDVCAGS